MDTWEYLDRSADLASIYGVQQRRNILTEQQNTQRLLQKQLDLEKARIDSEVALKAEERAKLDSLKKARKALCSIESLFNSLDGNVNVTSAHIVSSVVANEQLNLWDFGINMMIKGAALVEQILIFRKHETE